MFFCIFNYDHLVCLRLISFICSFYAIFFLVAVSSVVSVSTVDRLGRLDSVQSDCYVSTGTLNSLLADLYPVLFGMRVVALMELF